MGLRNKWDSANKYQEYYLKMCEGLPQLQSEWFPTAGHEFALNTLSGNEKTHKLYTICQVTTIYEKAKCFNGGKISNVNTKHRVDTPFRAKDGLTWVTFLPDLRYMMLGLRPYYCNVKEQLKGLNEMCSVHHDVSLRLHRMEIMALHLYGVLQHGLSWDYDMDVWVKMSGKAQWFKELKSIMVARGHYGPDVDMTKVWFTGIWESKYKYGVLIKNLRSQVQ